MRRTAALIAILACGLGLPQGRAEPRGWEEGGYLPLARGHSWVYKTDYEDVDLIHEVGEPEKVGEVECFVVDHKTHDRASGRSRSLRKLWLRSGEDGVRVHKLQRGQSELTVEKPFFRIKSVLRRDDEWKGEAAGAQDPPRYHYRVEGEVDVEVPAGKYRAWKIQMRVEQGERHQAEAFEWFARDVGMVKSEVTFKSGGEATTVVSELKEFRKGK